MVKRATGITFLVLALVAVFIIVRNLGSPGLPTVPRSKIPPPVIVHLLNTNSTLRIFSGRTMGAFLVLPDGSLWRWGGVGGGGFPKATVPQRVGTNYDWAEADSGGNHFAAIARDGTFWTWGYDFGAPTVSAIPFNPILPAPEEIGDQHDWVSVTAGLSHTALLKSDGTVWAWGHDEDAQMGNGFTPQPTNALRRWGPGRMQTNLVQVGTNRDWVALVGEEFHTFGIQRDGTLWVWGRLHEFPNGQTGQLCPTPTRVCSESNWVRFDGGLVLNSRHELWRPLEGPPSASASVSQTCRLFATNVEHGRFALSGSGFYRLHPDGTLWETRMKWSTNGPVEPAGPARQVGKRADWVSLCGIGTAFGLTSDGTVWMWGSDLGQEGVMPFNIQMKFPTRRIQGWLGMNTGPPVSAYWITPMQETPRPMMRMMFP